MPSSNDLKYMIKVTFGVYRQITRNFPLGNRILAEIIEGHRHNGVDLTEGEAVVVLNGYLKRNQRRSSPKYPLFLEFLDLARTETKRSNVQECDAAIDDSFCTVDDRLLSSRLASGLAMKEPLSGNSIIEVVISGRSVLTTNSSRP